MKITDGEKLVLLMLAELYDNLNVEGEIEPDFIRSAIFGDKTWSIPWKYSGIPFEDQEPPEIVKEVLDILEMWSVIEYSYNQLSEEEKQMVEKEAEPFGKDPKFKGFDGNNEIDHMSTASFLINDLERYEEFKDRYLNSHAPTLDAYHRMLVVFKENQKNIDYFPLNNEEIINILKEKTHPDHR